MFPRHTKRTEILESSTMSAKRARISWVCAALLVSSCQESAVKQ